MRKTIPSAPTREDAVADVLLLMGCALRGVSLTAAEVGDLRGDLSSALDMARYHSLDAACACALEGISTDALGEADRAALLAMREARDRTLYRSALFAEERRALEGFLQEAGIRYMPLKGILLESLYPRPGMRRMVDNDIWFDPAHREEVRRWFSDRGFRTVSFGKGNHDVYEKEPVFQFEMHLSLFSPHFSETLATHYDRKLAHYPSAPENACCLSFSPEELYVYSLAHQYKHYLCGGIGLRAVVDDYVLRTRLGVGLRTDAVRRETELLGIADFAWVLSGVSEKMLGADTSPLLPAEATLCRSIPGAGTFGTREMAIRQSLKRMDGGEMGDESPSAAAKLRYLGRRLCPPPEDMRDGMGGRSLPLPLAYLHRWLVAAPRRAGAIAKEARTVLRLRD